MNKPIEKNNLFNQIDGVEDISRRELNVKHFNLGGGRHQAVLFDAPVHYRDDSGELKEIDNNLVTDTVNGRKVFRNTANPMRVEFPVNASDGDLVRIAKDGKSLSWSLEGAINSSEAQRTDGKELLRRELIDSVSDMKASLAGTDIPAAKVMSTKALAAAAVQSGIISDEFAEVIAAADPATMSVEKLDNALRTPLQRRMSRVEKQSELRYDNLLPGVSARYTVADNCVKEDIIVADESALKQVAIRLPMGYNYRVNDDQSVSVMDGDEIAFTFNPPLVYDAMGIEEVAKVKLTHLENFILMSYVITPAFLEKATYPITIDPVAKTGYKDESAVTDCFIRSGNKDTVVTQDTILRCGFDGGEEFIPLIRFNQLIKLSAADTMLSAYVKLTAKYRQSDTYLACHEIKKMWYETGTNHVSWNVLDVDGANDAIDPTVLSYISKVSVYDQYFDITELCQKWYHLNVNQKQQNFGVAIRYVQGIDDNDQHIHWKATNGHTSENPRLVVNYISHAGVASWWQYQSMGAGRAGNANVDLYNGNLVFTHPDVSSTGNLMPVSVNHTYNSCTSDRNDFGCGFGWQTSLNQTMHFEKINGDTYYVWTDGSGTEHFFKKKSSTPYTDSEGMQLKLTFPSSSVARITSKDDTAMEFVKPTEEGVKTHLNRIRDALNIADSSKGSKIQLGYYEDGKLGLAIDGAGRYTTFSYNASGLLTRIAAPNGTSVSFAYSGQKLINVTYSDLASTQKTVYTYEGNLLTSAKNYDNIQVNIGYGASAVINPDTIDDPDDPDNFDQLTRRVISLETTSGNVAGAKQTFEYFRNITKVKNWKDNADGKTITYQFNDAGNVTCMFDELGYAQATTYSSTIPNTEEQSSKLQRAVMNYCPNIGFTSGWTKTGTGSLVRSSAGCLNMRTAKLSMTAGDEIIYSTPVQMLGKPNDDGDTDREYTFSAYIKRTGTITGDAFIRLVVGTQKYESRKISSVTTDISGGPGADGWDRVYVTGMIPVNSDGTPAVTVTLQLVCTGKIAYFSCPQLEVGSVPNRVNLLVNGDFSLTQNATTVSGVARKYPENWSVQDGVENKAENNIVDGNLLPVLFGNAFQMTSVPNKSDVAFQQTVKVSGVKGDTYVLGGWARSKSTAFIPTEDERHNAPCIVYRFVNDETEGEWKYLEFSREWVGWQFGCWPVVATGTYTQIDFRFDYSKNAQTAMFTNMFMYREQFGESFAYDSDKNVTSVANLANTQSKMEYDGAHNLKSYVQPGAASTEKYTFSYGSSTSVQKKHLLQTSITPMGVKQTFTYDDKGNQTMVKTGTSPVIGAKTSYTAEGTDAALASGINQNYVRRSYDARGNAVVKTVSETDYTLTSVEDPSGQVVNYAYDEAKRVKEVSTTASGKTYKNKYTYQNDRIATVRHNTDDNQAHDVVYTFGYDELGRKTTVTVGNGTTEQILSTNVYKSDRSGLLEKVQYGNGGKVEYEYDDFDRLTGVKYDDDTTNRYEYEYGANGAVAHVKDNHLMQTRQVEYDLAERPCQSTIIQHSDQDGDTVAYRTTLKYDDRSRLERFGEQTSSGSHTTTYTYDADNRTTKLLYDGSPKVEYTYDALGRITTRKATNGVVYTAQYGYVAGNTTLYGSGATTPLVASITQGSGANAMNFSYTYDERGNIVSEAYGGKTRTYVYDAIGQLIRVNDPWDMRAGSTGTTWTYEYDCGGNILNKKQYAYTTGTVGTVKETIPYAYADPVWKDKLTSYDGHTYTYDEIGNPIEFWNAEYRWEAGRQLYYTDQNGVGGTYSYNSDGLRIGKIVHHDWYPETYNYTYHGNLLTHLYVDYHDWNEQPQQDDMHFFYDAQGKPTMVKFNGVLYTYVSNLQGDIVAILDSSGAKVVEYKYDAWGYPIGESGSLYSTLGRRNPFRYRGYVFDEESGLYYLKSRYYDPDMGRFINADSYLGKTGELFACNQYLYCRNRPILFLDSDGNKPHAYFFYGVENEFAAFADSCVDDLMENGYSVSRYPVSSVAGFTNDWNNEMMLQSLEDEIDVVVILSHGSAYNVNYIDLSRLIFKKQIDTVVLLSCCGGHSSTADGMNVAIEFLNKSCGYIGKIIASDGEAMFTPKPGERSIWSEYNSVDSGRLSHTWIKDAIANARGAVGFVCIVSNVLGKYNITSIGGAFSSITKLIKMEANRNG